VVQPLLVSVVQPLLVIGVQPLLVIGVQPLLVIGVQPLLVRAVQPLLVNTELLVVEAEKSKAVLVAQFVARNLIQTAKTQGFAPQ
jgi:hypothetical protein